MKYFEGTGTVHVTHSACSLSTARFIHLLPPVLFGPAAATRLAMYISRDLFSSAYLHLKHHAHSTTPSILILVALDTDSLCATRILTQLLKRDFLPHKIHPVAGYKDLSNVNDTLIKGNEDLRFIICLGLGGMVDLEEFLDLRKGDGSCVECWVVDSRRPWNLHNVFGGKNGLEGQDEEGNGVLVVGGGRGQGIAGAKVSGGRWSVGNKVGGVKCFDDGDVEEEMEKEGKAFGELVGMPEVDSDEDDSDDDDDEDEDLALSRSEEDVGLMKNVVNSNGKKRRSGDGMDGDTDVESDEEDRSRRRKTMGGDYDDGDEVCWELLRCRTRCDTWCEHNTNSYTLVVTSRNPTTT